uniref:Uncharacterized protein n=1 Tax=Trichogramma kaykai TaxID=54128 RepID=A0ABD2XK01_9HYME
MNVCATVFPSGIACVSQVDSRRTWNGPAAKRTDVTDEVRQDSTKNNIKSIVLNKMSCIEEVEIEKLAMKICPLM